MRLLLRCGWFAGLGVACGALLMFAAQPASASWAPRLAASSTANAATSQSAKLESISCAAPGDCSAVGNYSDYMTVGQGLLLTETSGAWSPGVEAKVPANYGVGGAHHVELNSVSCASPGNCTAVGDYGFFPNHDPTAFSDGVLLRETGGAWAPGVEPILPANAASGGLYNLTSLSSVSCASAGDCSAVGSYTDSSRHLQGLLLTQTGGAWAAGIEASLPANAGSNPGTDLRSVSCASPGNCSAVGYYVDSSGHTQGLLFTQAGGTWAPGVEASLPANAGSNPATDLRSVSCASAGYCTAVGVYVDSSGNYSGLLLTESNGVWASGVKPSLPANATIPGADLESVSCASTGICTAVGSYETGRSTHGLLLSEAGGAWATGVEATLPANAAAAPSANLGSVSCASAGDCSAVGHYTDTSNREQGLLVSEAGGSWAPGVEATLPANANPNPGAELDAVSCASAGSCSAIGGYNDCADDSPGLLLTETGGAWAPPVDAIPPANAGPSGFSCSATLSGLRISPKTFALAGRRVNGRCVRQAANNRTHHHCTRPIRMTVGYRLGIPGMTAPSIVTFTVKRLAPGRRVGGRCVKPTNTNGRRRRCTRLIRVPGQITVPWLAGANSITFRGRVGGKTLGPGSYRLTATPEPNRQPGTPRTAAFKIES
jgi:hypothetical protein